MALKVGIAVYLYVSNDVVGNSTVRQSTSHKLAQ